MKPMSIKNKILWGISMIGLLAISYWLCRFLFFEIHGMKGWPNTLAMASLIIIIIATIFGKQIISITTLAGYIGGFIISMIFSTDGVDPGGGRTNNAWIIWGVVFIISILIGIILNFLYDKKHKNAKC